jgi:hypothetical protein
MSKVKGFFVHQNLGLWDRVIRLVIGLLMLGVPFVELVQPGSSVAWWHGPSMLLSVYPCLTGILGMDPILKMIDARTCSVNGRNQCGSFPYQVDAILGHNPIPEQHLEHELSHSSHTRS